MSDSLILNFSDKQHTLALEGELNLASYEQCAQKLDELDPAGPLLLEGSRLQKMDTSGAWQLVQFKRRWEATGEKLEFSNFPEKLQQLINYVEASIAPMDASSPQAIDPSFLRRLGERALHFFHKTMELSAFLGEVCLGWASLMKPRELRWRSVITHMELAGIDALPIVGLISFLIGVVLTFQGADQLSRFGAQIYTVNLVGISILREVGILLTAIVVAGRSGSAFTAQIGSMKLNQEIDALQTMGLKPFTILVMPRVLALVLVMPLLAFFADLSGILGGALMSYLHLNISFELFFHQLKQSLTFWTFWIGILKAPVFAFVIALVGCYEGFAVENKAESIGQHTTWSVVESITFVILADALFSILFTRLGI